MTINLISDTVTKPTKEMLAAMMDAEVGDDVFGADPTVNELQRKASEMFGYDAALFFPSGTMANQTAIKLHTHLGDQLICDKWAHVYNYEGGGAASNSGVSCKLIDGDRGMFTAAQLKQHINNPQDIHAPISKLVTIENTTNKGGGACWEYEELKAIKNVCMENDMALHLDGARLFNALVAKNESTMQYGFVFDTISICLSKSLGCPVGSLLLGNEKHIKQALRLRKVFGGGMRQVGYLAAAGIYALNHHIERLAEDHQRAKTIEKELKGLSYITHVEPVETNIIIFNIDTHISEIDFLERLRQKNILIVSMGHGKLRMVTHLDFTDAMLAILVKELKNLY